MSDRTNISKTPEYKALAGKKRAARELEARRLRAEKILKRVKAGEEVTLEFAQEFGFGTTTGLLTSVARITGYLLTNNGSKAPKTNMEMAEDLDAKRNRILTQPIV